MSLILYISDFELQCKHLEKFKSNRATKNRRRNSKVFCIYETVALRAPSQLFKTGELQICSYRGRIKDPLGFVNGIQSTIFKVKEALSFHSNAYVVFLSIFREEVSITLWFLKAEKKLAGKPRRGCTGTNGRNWALRFYRRRTIKQWNCWKGLM